MTPRPQTLFMLFGDLITAWPSSAVRENTGDPHGDPASPGTWLTALNESVQLHELRTGASDSRVAVQAELTVDPAVGFLGYPDGWPFVITSMPDVELRILPFTEAGHSVGLFASAGDSGAELLVEGLPVEIRLPAGLVEPHPDTPGGPDGTLVVDTGDFKPGRFDDLRVVYRRGDVTSVFVHVRLYVNEAYEFDIQPAVPVSFGACALSGIPCSAVYDFRLMPSPALAGDYFEWLRHGVEPWLPDLVGPYDGLFAVRSVDIDENAQSLKNAIEWFNNRRKDPVPTAELVLGDLVVPFFGPLPVPRHVTTGIRRNVLDPGVLAAVFEFDRAPVYLQMTDTIAFVVESIYYQSEPADDSGPPSGLASGRRPGTPEGLGLTFSAAIVFGKDQSPQQALEIGLEEDFTLVAGYKRDFSSTLGGQPLPTEGAPGTLDALLHWQIANTVILDVMTIRVGFSLGRFFGAQQSFKESALATVDLFVSMPPTGGDDSFFQLRALDGQPVAFALENVGWRVGQLHLEGLALPDGVVAYFWVFALIIYEVGLSSEDGASYVSVSGGLGVKRPAGLAGAVTVKRLRFRVAGSESAPATKLDGFFLFFSTADKSVVIQAGGYYTEQQVDDTHVREIGVTGTAGFTFGDDKYLIGLDLLLGQSKSPNLSFDYLMAQVFYKGTFPAPGGFEITGARLLYARNMLPKLTPVDAESRELRYYRWYKQSNDPLVVPGDRRLASWSAEDDAWAFGVGLSASMPAFGKVVDLTVFVLGVDGASEKGLLVVGEVFAFHKQRPLGYLALEVDRRNHRTSILVGVDARASSFLDHAPAWMDGIGTFTGTLFISNSPGTFAIGRLADQSTWLALRFKVDLWHTSLVVAICVELVEDGPKGFGMTSRLEGGIGKQGSRVRLTFNAGWSMTVLFFTTGSTDYAAVISISAGIHFELFGFLRIGVSARMDFRVVGASPSRGELTAELRLETPWFLPDVTWRLDCQFGELAPADLSAAVQPLRTAGATEPAANRQLPTHLERFDPSWNGDGVAPVHSVNELTAPTRSEQERLANVDADGELRPVAIDATIGILWSVAVNDKLGLGGATATGLGDQQSGDLTLTYDLVGIAVRRRARFGPDRSWQPLDQTLELGPDFSSNSGVQLSGSFAPQIVNKIWDVDVRIEGQPAPKKLLLNGVAPYEFTTASPEGDEELARRFPSWPCCQRANDKYLLELFHTVDWRASKGGAALSEPLWSQFSESRSTLRFLAPAWTHPAVYTGLTPGAMVAAAELAAPGIVARADLDEDAAFVRATVAWPQSARVALVAFDGTGAEVARRDLGPGTGTHRRTMFGAKGPIRRLELRAYLPSTGPAGVTSAQPQALLEIDEVGYVGLRDYLDLLVAEKACSGGVPGGGSRFDGSGKLSFLPNHEYEVKLTTRVTIAHPSTQQTSADVDEFVYFRTKGLPGLNAVARVGEELDPYVRGAYAGGRGGFVYREEPVTLAFSEGLHVAIPLTDRPPPGAPEHTTLLEMQLLVTPTVATAPATAFTATDDDWIVTHRGTAPPPPQPEDVYPWRGLRTISRGTGSSMTSADPFRLRLAAMTQRPAVTCGLADPTQVGGTVLVAPPQGGGLDPEASPPGSSELWAGGSRFVACVRVKGAGFVDRRPFVDGDQTALSIHSEGAPASWAVQDGELRVETDGAGRSIASFGDADWDHLTVVAGLAPGATTAGVGFGVQGTDTSGALFAVVEDGSPQRVVIRRADGTELAVAALAAPATDTIELQATLFDDRLRAAVGDVVAEVERGDTPSGRVCLLAEGAAAFRSLQVRGLELYQFPFAVSGFRSFGEHVGSGSGKLDEVTVGMLGGSGSSATVSQLWSTTATDVQRVMVPDAASADRERVFATWVDGLGVPLRDELAALEITRVVDGAQTCALLLESPEPLDFTEEIAVTLTHSVPTGTGPVRPRRPPIGPVAPLAAPTPGIRERLETLVFEPPPEDRGVALPPPDEAIIGVERLGSRLLLRLEPALGRAGRLAVVAVGIAGATLYEGLVRPGPAAGLPATMVADPVGPLVSLPPAGELRVAITHAQEDTLLLASVDLLQLLGIWRPRGGEVDVTVPVQVLQNGDARRALVVPVDGPLAPDTYHLRLDLSRKRWQTTDPADELNTYRRSAVLALNL